MNVYTFSICIDCCKYPFRWVLSTGDTLLAMSDVQFNMFALLLGACSLSLLQLRIPLLAQLVKTLVAWAAEPQQWSPSTCRRLSVARKGKWSAELPQWQFLWTIRESIDWLSIRLTWTRTLVVEFWEFYVSLVALHVQPFKILMKIIRSEWQRQCLMLWSVCARLWRKTSTSTFSITSNQ